MDNWNERIVEKIDDDILEEIISELARVGRPDLIQILRQHFDYTTESSESSEEYSDSEVVSETIEVEKQHDENFVKLK